MRDQPQRGAGPESLRGLFAIALVFGLGLLTGCGTWSSAQKGTAIGVGLGGAAGAAVTGSTLGTVGGAALGGIIGHEVGEKQDDKTR